MKKILIDITSPFILKFKDLDALNTVIAKINLLFLKP